MNENQLAVLPASPLEMWANPQSFEHWQRIAVMLAKSELVPKAYQDKPQNVMLAMEMAHRMGVGAVVVMQNLDIIDGRQSWKSTFVASMINVCGRYKQLRYKYEDRGLIDVDYIEWGQRNPQTGKAERIKRTAKIQNLACTAYAEELGTGEILFGETVTVEMAVKDGWYFRSNSKWATMTRQMLAYRSATFFARLYEPHLLNGMRTTDEVFDITDVQNAGTNPLDKVNNSFGGKQQPIATSEAEPQIIDAQEVHDESGGPAGGFVDDDEIA